VQTDLLTDIPRIETRSHTPPDRKAQRGAGNSERTLQCTCHDPTADQYTRLKTVINLLTPNVNYSGRTAPLTSKVAFYIFIQQIYVLNILNMVYTLRFFSLQNAVCFTILTYLVPGLFTFYIQGVLKLKK